MGTPNPPSSAEELAGLDRVLHRLALTEEDKLEKVEEKGGGFVELCLAGRVCMRL